MKTYIKNGKKIIAIDTKAKQKLDNVHNGQHSPYFENIKDINFLVDDYEVVLGIKPVRAN